MSFFDIVLDFILMDAFEDLENPPSSVLAVLRNRWLSDSFKETVGGCHPASGTHSVTPRAGRPHFLPSLAFGTKARLPTHLTAVTPLSGTPFP